MKKLIALAVILAMICGISLAETWCPFGIVAEDDYQTAAEKLKTTLADRNVDEHSNYIIVKTPAITLEGLRISQVTLNRPGGLGNPDAPWRLVLFADVTQDRSDMSSVYRIYKGLVELYGEPLSVSLTIKNITFAGTEEKSLFETEDVFLDQACNAPEKIKAEFECCDLSIDVHNFLSVSVALAFNQKKD